MFFFFPDIKSMAKKILNLLLARSVRREEEEQKDETPFSIFQEKNLSNDLKDLSSSEF
jgi:hypothetical protein